MTRQKKIDAYLAPITIGIELVRHGEHTVSISTVDRWMIAIAPRLFKYEQSMLMILSPTYWDQTGFSFAHRILIAESEADHNDAQTST